MNKVKAGDFTGLAKDYSLHRPDYCHSVLKGLLGLLNSPVSQIDFADVGAGTGIWTGPGITESGTWNPSLVEAGSIDITYALKSEFGCG